MMMMMMMAITIEWRCQERLAHFVWYVST